MKRRSLILLAVFLVLIMIPMSFGNVAASEYAYSPESVTSFSETLEDDVLFYPDAIEPQITDGNVSASETNDYTATYVNDATYWQNQATGPDLYTYFDINGSFPVDTMYLEIDSMASGPIASHTLQLFLYNPQGTDLLIGSHSGVGAGVDAVLNGWYNVTAWGKYEYNSMHTFYLFTTGSVNPTNILVDYFRLSFMTGASQADPVLADPSFATGGTTGFGNTYAVDSDNLTLDASGVAVLEFSYTAFNISSLVSFTYAIYGISDGSAFVYYSSDGIDYGTGAFDVITYEGWYNGTYNTALGALENTGTGYVMFVGTDESFVNYMEISFTYIPISGYGESFSEVSDFAKGADCEAGDTFTTDGDVASFSSDWGGGTDVDWFYTNTPSLQPDYWEIRYKLSTVAVGSVVLQTCLNDGGSTGSIDWAGLTKSTDWITYKFYAAVGIVESFRFYISTGIDVILYVDYIRAGPSDEMGVQHDGSTTEGFDERTISVVTDGDTLNISNSGASDFCNLWFDTTSTAATISDLYYPFIEFNISAVKASSNAWLFRVYDSDGTSFTYGYTYATGTFRFNLAAVANLDDLKYIRFYCVEDQWFTLEYVKLYSIADFSYAAGGGESTNDYSYVEDGKLIVNTDTYTKWNHDPTLSIPITTYGLWNATIEGDDSGFRFRELEDTNTIWDQGITNGILVGTTFEDFDLLIYSNCNISAVSFYGVVPAWNIITTVEIVFWVPGWHIISSIVIVFTTEISTYAINLILLFLGLAMIPTSTIFLVKGGRGEMSTDKLLVVILCFFMGWALFLGGIFG